jgi:hypothetical protein
VQHILKVSFADIIVVLILRPQARAAVSQDAEIRVIISISGHKGKLIDLEIRTRRLGRPG